MSASREKKTRQSDPNKGLTQTQRKELQEQKAAKRKAVLYTVIGVIVAVLVVILLVWDSGIFQRREAAVSVGGRDYSVTDVMYYYGSALSQESLYSQYGMSSFDTSVDPAEQYRDEAQTQTYHDYFLDQAVTALTSQTALLNAADEAGYTMTEEDQATVDEAIESMRQTAEQYGRNLAGYLKARFGRYMTPSAYRDCVERAALINGYANSVYDGLTYTDEEIQTYYEENADTLDTFQYYYAFIDGTAESTTDEEGNTVEPTEEESTAAMEEAKAQADAFAAALNEADDKAAAFGELLADYVGEDSVDTYSPLRTTVGSGLASSYSEWMQDAGRTAGDVTVAESTTSSSTGYYVVLFMDRYRDETPTVDIRHILIRAELTQEDDESTEDVDESQIPTQEALDAAKAEAEDLLAQWEAGDKTAESFGELANEYSDDTGSNTNGGLYEQVYEGQMFEAFNDWIFDEARQEGDTTVLENPQDGQQGWHVIYFQSWDDPVWKNTADSSLRGTDYNAWLTEIQDGLEATEGSGINYVG